MKSHEHWMQQALVEARRAAAMDEVPVGAVLVDLADGLIIGRGCNQPLRANDPTAHAEIGALRCAARLRRNYRLPGTALYVTVEPCTMCTGALIHARVALLVFGAREPRAGAVVSQRRLLSGNGFNHHPAYEEGILGDECGALMQAFFRARRSSQGSAPAAPGKQ